MASTFSSDDDAAFFSAAAADSVSLLDRRPRFIFLLFLALVAVVEDADEECGLMPGSVENS